MAYRENPLIASASRDRQSDPLGTCVACGARVSGYNCNESLVAMRPEGSKSDWWAACDNAGCENAYGEDFFQAPPDWVVEK